MNGEPGFNETLARAAFRYALRRVAVFPLAPGAKVPPKDTHGLTDATDDHDVTRARWQRCRGANIGAATGAASGFWVLDVDPDHGGAESLAALEAVHGLLPATIEASTPSGGRHLYWKWRSADPELRNSAGRVGKGLDVRGNGGQIVLPPSRLRDGRGYAWVRNGATSFADAPGWLADLALPPPPPPPREPVEAPANMERYIAAAIAGEFTSLEQAGNGTRNHTLNRVAFNIGQLIAINAVPQDWAEAELERRAVKLGLNVVEARRTIASGLGAGIAHPRDLPHG
jgi:hypothetical protein